VSKNIGELGLYPSIELTRPFDGTINFRIQCCRALHQRCLGRIQATRYVVCDADCGQDHETHLRLNGCRYDNPQSHRTRKTFNRSMTVNGIPNSQRIRLFMTTLLTGSFQVWRRIVAVGLRQSPIQRGKARSGFIRTPESKEVARVARRDLAGTVSPVSLDLVAVPGFETSRVVPR
jgi:hypothetical protein